MNLVMKTFLKMFKSYWRKYLFHIIIGTDYEALLAGLVSGVHTWWPHQTEIFSALLALCAGNSPATGEFPAQRSVTWSFDVFFICAWINRWVNNREAGDLRLRCAHYDVTVVNSTCDIIVEQILTPWFCLCSYNFGPVSLIFAEPSTF